MREPEHDYLYALTRPPCNIDTIGTGVDPRFPVELVRSGRLLAVVSHIGLDDFNPKRLEGGNAKDIAWLNRVALRHHEIVASVAENGPVLPMRVGAIFRSRASLSAALAVRRKKAEEFLDELGDKAEWSVKLFMDETDRPDEEPAAVGASTAKESKGAAYLTRRRDRLANRASRRDRLRARIEEIEPRLRAGTEDYRPIKVLPSALTGRRERMVFGGAYLVSASNRDVWLDEVQRIRDEVQPDGLLLDWSGPAPPYHFCPDFE